MEYAAIIDTKNIDNIDFSYMNKLIDVNILRRINQKKLKQDQINSIVGLSFSKLLLQQYFHIPISEIIIFNDLNNKPYIDMDGIFFNYSHSSHYVAIYLSTEYQVGIDIECPKETGSNFKTEILSIVENMFSKNQRAYFLSKPVNEQGTLFYKLWVCNEAFLKWYGIGLTRGMKFYDFQFEQQAVFAAIPVKKKLIPISFFYTEHYKIYLALCNGVTQINKLPEVIDGHQFIKQFK